MKNEPKKTIKDLDLACFKQVFIPVDPNRSLSTFFVSGTSDAYAKLIPFLENQIEMVENFGSATKTIFFRKPHEFTTPLQAGSLHFNNRQMTLNFLTELKLKVLSAAANTDMQLLEGSQLHVTTNLLDLKATLETCRMRQHNQTHGAHFLGFGTPSVSSAPLGDWYGIE